MKISYISWAAHCSRSDHTARELGGTSHMVYWAALGSHPLTVWLKYIGQAIHTWRVLSGERPAAVFVMAPPVFAPLVGWLWCATHQAQLVIDAHTAAFTHARWRYFQRLQFFLARRATTTIVHNDHLKELVERHGAHATLVADLPALFPSGTRYTLPPGFNVAIVCSFNPDEPIAAMIDAARLLPDVTFHMTGNPIALDPELGRSLPHNLRLTGFLSDAAYGSLIGSVGAVMTLTTRDHTMLRGAWEAVYQGTPVIISDWPVLKQAFDDGALHVNNSSEAIAAAVRELLNHHSGFREAVLKLRDRKASRWLATRQALRVRLQDTARPPLKS